MERRFVACAAALLALGASGVFVACVASNPAGPPSGAADASCTPPDGSISAATAQIDAGLCGACVVSECAASIAMCSNDCTCESAALEALGCIEGLGGGATTLSVANCLEPLNSSVDPALDNLGACLQGCAGACGLDAGNDAAIPEAGVDSTIPEAGPDSAVPEAGPDSAAPDAGPDSTIPDAGSPDAGEDAAPDSGGVDGSACITSISGTVYDPGGNNPLPGVQVYVPSGTPPAFPSGAVCSCAGLESAYVVGAVTNAQGQFSISGVPAGNTVPLVTQVGKWRTQGPITVTACQDNAVPKARTTLPASSAQGDMPNIAVSTGSADALECLLSRMGINPSEWVGGNSPEGHVHVFLGGDGAADAGLAGEPEKNGFSGGQTSSTLLWGSVADMTPYDLVLLSCEGGETYGAIPSVLESYLNAGGRVLASHYHYSWFTGALVSGQSYGAQPDWGTNGSSLATWTGGSGVGDGGTTIGATPQTKLTDGGVFPEGVLADTWLNDVGALTSGELSITTPRYNATVSTANVSQPWLLADNSSGDPGAAMLFTFDTPLDAAPGDSGAPAYCGRAAYTDLHDGNAADTVNTVGGQPPPNGCAPGKLSPQELELELMLFDLSGCVVPDSAGPALP